MGIGLILAAEIAFWVVLGGGLVTRYVLRRRRLSNVLLLCVPVVDLVLLTVTVVDLRSGGEPSWAHGLSALYLGFTVAYGHYVIHWADGHAAHWWGGGPRPQKPPRYGAARARHEWRLWAMTLAGALIAIGVLEAMLWLIGDVAGRDRLRATQSAALRAVLIHGVVAATYSIWQKRPPAEAAEAPAPVGTARDTEVPR
ncbi:hypothetical protein [Streptomyces avicenniae]|uniref:hypothetical protein n=1 Tax=Streptomyces avicenniae TaxID=500153 RepID=UPI00069BDF74|nr:hypothetical protein [Streptomyces avicenniae]